MDLQVECVIVKEDKQPQRIHNLTEKIKTEDTNYQSWKATVCVNDN